MTAQIAGNFRPRRDFGKIKRVVEIPNLIEIQRRSYEEFLQADFATDERRDVGLQAVFKSVFPIKDFNDTAELDFVAYSIGEPKFDIDECHQRGNNFAAPLKVTVHLVIYERDEVSGTKSRRVLWDRGAVLSLLRGRAWKHKLNRVQDVTDEPAAIESDAGRRTAITIPRPDL